ncbi:MAG: sulfite exporter TauE/SafE family protein, partial [Desulfobacteraceae bacterium]|nr:sulfite exporter TauE/SafE family protein [Desulfobacteraceae bacterium]
MKKIFMHFIMMTLVLLFTASGSFAGDGISAASYKAGDAVEITGKIAPGQDLYIAIAQQKMFAPQDTTGTH